MSADAFYAIFVDVDELVCLQKAFDVWPELGKDGVESRSAQVAETEMHHFWRRFAKNDPVREIRIFSYDDETVFGRICPKRVILHAGSESGGVNRLGVLKAHDARRQILVEEKSIHLTEMTE